MAERESYNLRQIVELTGITEFTLRGWESRYGAFQPRRTETGRRQYSAADLRRAILLRELTARGERISTIARLSLVKLNALLEREDVSPISEDTAPEVVNALKLATLQEWEKLEKYFREIARQRKPLSVVHGFVAPLLGRMGNLVAEERLSIAQEHVLSSLTKELLHRLRERASPPAEGNVRLLIAAPENDFHELGILVAHTIAAQHGVRSLYLGPNSPKKDLCETALRFGATHVVIGSTVARVEGAKEGLPAYLHFLDTNLPPKVTVWVAGREGARLATRLERPCATIMSYADFEERLKALRA